MRTRSVVAVLASWALAPLLLAGCGGDDPPAAAPPTTTTTAAVPGTTEVRRTTTTTEAEPTTTTSSSSSSTTTAPPDDPPPGGDEPHAFCGAWTAFVEASDDLPDETLEDLLAGSAVLADVLADAVERAPGEVADPVTLVSGWFARFRAEVAHVATLDEAAELSDRLEAEEPGLHGAVEAIETWVEEQCPRDAPTQVGVAIEGAG